MKKNNLNELEVAGVKNIINLKNYVGSYIDVVYNLLDLEFRIKRGEKNFKIFIKNQIIVDEEFERTEEYMEIVRNNLGEKNIEIIEL